MYNSERGLVLTHTKNLFCNVKQFISAFGTYADFNDISLSDLAHIFNHCKMTCRLVKLIGKAILTKSEHAHVMIADQN